MRAVVILLLATASSVCAQADTENAYDQSLQFIDKKNYQQALAPLDKLVKDYPDDYRFRQSRALCLFNLKRYKEAASDYRVLFTFADQDSEFPFQAGNAYENIDSLQLAIRFYSEAIKMEKTQYLYFFKRGTTYLKLNQWQNAIDDFSVSLKINEESHNALHNRGIAYYKIGSKEKACNDWCEAVVKGNPYSASHLQRNCQQRSCIPKK
jgi:tetratricopeptide (TPR) repeat protein